MNIRTVTVIGANGTMGCYVSAIFASFGNAKVYMVSRTEEKSRTAVDRAAKSVRADSIRRNLVPVDYSVLEHCVQESDLIFESVREDLGTKLEIASRITPYLRDNALICSGSSGLSITTIAESYPEKLRSRCFGVHFFNPPYVLTVCELIPTFYSDQTVYRELHQYLKKTLCRTVAEVKDSPAFLGNRIGFQFINAALLSADYYQQRGGIDYIDAILGPFSGRSMPPLVTADFVGLDVHKAIVDNLHQNTSDYANDSFRLPLFTSKLIESGALGKKVGYGLYKSQRTSECRKIQVYDIGMGVYRDIEPYRFPFVTQMVKALRIGDYAEAFRVLINSHSAEAELCVDFLLRYTIYALNVTRKVGFSIHGADDVMAEGFNLCPPLALMQAFSSVADIRSLMRERLDKTLWESGEIEELLPLLVPSNYNYRIFFRSTR